MHAQAQDVTAEPDVATAAVDGADAAARRGFGFRDGALWLGVLALTALLLLWPGDIPWVNDEPALIDRALDANQAGRLCLLGLPGSVGLRYGPVPSWIYQALLLLTHDLVLLAFLKALASVAVLVCTLWRLSRLLALPRVLILFALASPFVNHLVRMLWDNSFTVVLSPLLLLAALLAIERRSLAWLAGFTLLASALVHTHLQTVFVIGPLYVVLLWSRRQDWLRRRWAVAVILALGAASLAPYARYAWGAVTFGDTATAGAAEVLTSWALGARYFSGLQYVTHYLPEMLQADAGLLAPNLTRALIAVGVLAVVGCAHGLLLALLELRATWRERRPFAARQYLSAMCLLALLCAGAYHVVSGQAVLHHYLVGTWMCYGYFLWRSFGWLCERRPALGGLIIGLQLAALVALLVAIRVFVHVNGGNRSPLYGATLGNQIAVMRDLLQYRPAPGTSLGLRVQNYQDYSAALIPLQKLETLNQPIPDPDTRPQRLLRIVYADPLAFHDGHIKLDVREPPPDP